MSAIDIRDWIRALFEHLKHNRQRHLVLLDGPDDWCETVYSALEDLPQARLVLSDRIPAEAAVPLRNAPGSLGSEALLVVLDLRDGFDPDLICVAAGLLESGGILLVLGGVAAPVSLTSGEYASPSTDLLRFRRYFVDALRQAPEVASVIEPEGHFPNRFDLPVLEPAVFENGVTRAQADCLQQMNQWIDRGDRGVVSLCADRGRGKSSCLGLLLQQLPASCRVSLSADSRRQTETVMRFAPGARYLAPDQLLLTLPEADLVVIDEAAMIPQSLLRQISDNYPRLLLATTTAGYEGTGRGFRLRFLADLDRESLLELSLQDPIRWCAGDRLEQVLNEVLLLNEITEETVPDGFDAQEISIELFEQPALTCDDDTLIDAYRLLSAAHYRTRPSDLRRLMTDPDLMLLVAGCRERLIGAALVSREGGFDAELCQAIFMGNRRPAGHLLAQLLTAQAGVAGFAIHRGLRVQRIAVHLDFRRRGIGSRLVERLTRYADELGFDYLGASFALEPASTGFWRQAGFDLAHVGYARGKSSGSHSIAVLKVLTAAASGDLEQLQQRIQRQLPLWMCQFLALLDVDQAMALLRLAKFSAELTGLENDEITAFAHGNKGFELCFSSLQRFVMERAGSGLITPEPLLIYKAVQNRHWDRLGRDRGDQGRRQLQQQLRRLIAAELEAAAIVPSSGLSSAMGDRNRD